MAANRAHGALLQGKIGAGIFADKICSYRDDPREGMKKPGMSRAFSLQPPRYSPKRSSNRSNIAWKARRAILASYCIMPGTWACGSVKECTAPP